ncbi:MAG: hypothetical protein PHS59_08130 [Paludibacter sp.]|nr:hypothetical protein [Paludibacter sp.]
MTQIRLIFISIILFIGSILQLINAKSQCFSFSNGADVKVQISKEEAEVVQSALDIFSRDYQQVFQGKVIAAENGNVLIGTLGQNSPAEKLVNKTDVQELKKNGKVF